MPRVQRCGFKPRSALGTAAKAASYFASHGPTYRPFTCCDTWIGGPPPWVVRVVKLASMRSPLYCAVPSEWTVASGMVQVEAQLIDPPLCCSRSSLHCPSAEPCGLRGRRNSAVGSLEFMQLV